MVSISKVISIFRRDGLYATFKKAISFAYNHYIAPLLPLTKAVYNGVDVKDARLFDSILPWRDKDKPYWEYNTIRGIESNVNKGDVVVVVGGGLGVTAVRAAQEAGCSGQVFVYEGSSKRITQLQDTIERNDVSDRVDITHGVVGPLISLDGVAGDAIHVSPEKLPECDVLELDCEGAEIEILEKLTIRPGVILVESHGMNGATSSKIEDILKEMSYSVVSKEPADKVLKEYCVENDIYNLVAVRD
ncbi:FkbM family methyltransferase [Haloarcula rubripromontorii]|uniref:FkbM family methyltransferase n=1 Tax=Haloarcula rubripromontorii TaxID=1705562 RepID=UPI00345BEBEC